jgi:maleate isomerase
MLHVKSSSGSGPEPIRVGMIVPSSNVTMERELPAMLRARESFTPDRFSIHSNRVRMRSVTPEELAAMNLQARRAAAELSDTAPDVVVFACLVAVMVEGPGAHRRIEQELAGVVSESGSPAPVVSSAGALVETLHDIEAARVAMIAPYLPPLTERVCDYLGSEGINVVDAISLSVANNSAVGRLSQDELLGRVDELPRDVDAVVLSACVQMPSLPAIDAAQERTGLPVLTAATATARGVLGALDLPAEIPGGGALLAERVSGRAAG